MNSDVHSADELIKEIMRLHRSLLPRPAIEEVEAAMDIISDVDAEEKSRTEAIGKQVSASDIPEELFSVFQEMQRCLVRFQSKGQRREAMKLLDVEGLHNVFDDLLQRASECLPLLRSNGSAFKSLVNAGVGEVTGIYLKKASPEIKALGHENEKLNLIKLASLIEISSKKGIRDLNLQNKLMDEVDWLPNSMAKLSSLTTLNLSENSLLSLPTAIGFLSSLTELSFRANRITELPNSMGDLLSLSHLNMAANQISSLPMFLGKLVNLVELNCSSNKLSSLPDAIGQLIHLKKLNIEANNIEEIPHTIGNCKSLAEFRADYNHLKCLPEAIGRLEFLEVISVRYNNIKGLPTTVASLSRLREIDASFNELESLPESLCLVTTLVKLNVGNNFADLQSLPRAIGNFEMLEELDISNNQIKVLPDSFGMLTQLCVLRMEENPLEVPPKNVAEMGAQTPRGRKKVEDQ
ncbi:hypothetical protein KSP39_PZI011803 [Platanthera zijinensis]|uniref:Uncharacterized protein n=1 Tax=Platanthera zijinensis TaxID=2320716 RepID=A0AAP0BEX9_9ASPA